MGVDWACADAEASPARRSEASRLYMRTLRGRWRCVGHGALRTGRAVAPVEQIGELFDPRSICRQVTLAPRGRHSCLRKCAGMNEFVHISDLHIGAGASADRVAERLCDVL